MSRQDNKSSGCFRITFKITRPSNLGFFLLEIWDILQPQQPITIQQLSATIKGGCRNMHLMVWSTDVEDAKMPLDVPSQMNNVINDQLPPCIMSVQYAGGCAVQWGMFSTLGDIMSTRGCSVYWGDIMSTPGGYHDKCWGRSLGKQLNLYGNPSVLNIPCCTHAVPHCAEHPPVCS